MFEYLATLTVNSRNCSVLPQSILLYRHGFSKVPGLIHVETFRKADIVSEKLQRDDGEAADEMLLLLGDVDREACGILYGVVAVARESHEIRAPGPTLRHVAELNAEFNSAH